MSQALESRLRRLETRQRPLIPQHATVVTTVADANDEAEHQRQATKQKAAAVYVAGTPLIHLRRGLIDPPPWTRSGAAKWQSET